LKILCTGDLHLGSKRRRINPDMVLEGDKEILDQIVQVAIEECVDSVFILGDLFDSIDVSPRVVELCLDRLNQIKNTNIYIFPGNHDYEIDFNSNNITVFKGWMQKDIRKEITVYGYGFQNENKDFWNWKFDFNSQINIICGHFSVNLPKNGQGNKHKNRQRNSEICLNTHDIACWNADIVLLGHDHTSRSFKKGDKLIAAYVGSPYNIFENEWVSRGVVICDIEKDNISLKLRRLECPRDFKVKAKNKHTANEIKEKYSPIPVGEYTWELLSPLNINAND